MINLIKKFGKVLKVKIVKDKKTDKSKGFGFITMANANEAYDAIYRLDSTFWVDRKIKLRKADENSSISKFKLKWII